MSDVRVTLITRAGCHLCEEARDVVARVAADTGVPWAEREIGGDADLERAYGELVPVVLVDGEQHAYWRVDEQRLRSALSAPRGGSGPSWLTRWRDRTP